MNGERSDMKEFLRRKNFVFSVDRYAIKALGAMAQGLFATLLAGLIVKTIGELLSVKLLVEIGSLAMSMMGPGIALAVAHGLGAPPAVLFASIVTGLAGANFGGPAGALIAAMFGAEFGKIVYKQTKLDIMITPMVTILAGYLAAMVFGPPINTFMNWLGLTIMWATELQPLIMGVIVATLVGLSLTGPISSAALAIMLDLSGLAAGASTAGCCAQMVGFAVMSFSDNRWEGLLTQGLGTSKIQMPNVIKNPWILLPPTLAGMITGPLSITVWQMENLPAGAGMGSSGLVGQILTISAMGINSTVLLAIALLHFLLPACLTLLFAVPLRRTGKIKQGDLKLEL
jgi:uncharacterized membrane protein